MALLVLVAFTSASCDVGCASGCGPNTLFSGGALGGALATAGATIVQNDFGMLLEPYAGLEETLVWEGYASPIYDLSSVCMEEGPCLAYESFPGAFGFESTPYYVSIGAHVVRWPAPTMDPGAESAPVSDLGTLQEPHIVVVAAPDLVDTYAETSEFVLGILATMGTLLGHLPGILGAPAIAF